MEWLEGTGCVRSHKCPRHLYQDITLKYHWLHTVFFGFNHFIREAPGICAGYIIFPMGFPARNLIINNEILCISFCFIATSKWLGEQLKSLICIVFVMNTKDISRLSPRGYDVKYIFLPDCEETIIKLEQNEKQFHKKKLPVLFFS